MKIVSIVGARPQFIKLAPLVKAIQELTKSNSKLNIKHLIIHTGQHYDYEMNKIFFDELGIPEPDYNLEVGSGSHGWQTGEIIKRAEEVLIKEQPEWVLVYGDANSTLSGALTAAKLHIPVAHVESGLRSYNKKMPEEINRVLTDYSSNVLFCPTENAARNLKKEGFTNIINKGKLISSSSFNKTLTSNAQFPLVINVGDIMYDSLLMSLKIAEKNSIILEKLKLSPKKYYLATLHRAENTDDKNRLKNILEALIEISKENPVIFPIHPRTKKSLETFQLSSLNFNQLLLVDSISYFDMLIVQKNAKKILTDSGGVQKEAYILKVPCVTFRDETEWIETLKGEWNVLVGAKREKIIKATQYFRSKGNHYNYFGRGKTAKKIVEILTGFLQYGK